MQEALQSAQTLAANRNHTEFDNEHFLIALLEQPEGVTKPLFEKLGINVANAQSQLEAAIAKRAQVHGTAAQANPAAELLAILRQAEKEMAKLKDEYLSAEHYLLALADSGVSCGKLVGSLGVTHAKLMQALQQVRGSQRVTDQNPEDKYQTLQLTDAISRTLRARGRSIRSSGATTKSAARCRCFRGAQRTTRSSSASPAWARRPSSKASRDASSRATFPSR